MFFPVQLTKESCELIVAALRKLPHEQVHDLVMDIVAQANKALEPKQPAPVPVAEEAPVDDTPL